MIYYSSYDNGYRTTGGTQYMKACVTPAPLPPFRPSCTEMRRSNTSPVDLNRRSSVAPVATFGTRVLSGTHGERRNDCLR